MSKPGKTELFKNRRAKSTRRDRWIPPLAHQPKRGPDLRQIRLSRCYTVQEAAMVLGVSTGTVRAWIRRGLPVLEQCNPPLIPGDGMKAWLMARAKARKHPCQPDELYCCRCRSPQKAEPGSVEITPRNAKTVAIRACVIPAAQN